MKSLSSKQTLEIVSKPWCSSKDFSILSNTGKNTTLKLMKELRYQLEQDNYYFPCNMLPMDKVVEYLNLNLTYLNMVNELTNTEYIERND